MLAIALVPIWQTKGAKRGRQEREKIGEKEGQSQPKSENRTKQRPRKSRATKGINIRPDERERAGEAILKPEIAQAIGVQDRWSQGTPSSSSKEDSMERVEDEKMRWSEASG